MILKINLAACVVFVLASLGILLYGGIPIILLSSDLLVVLIYASPTLLWITGAWAARRRRWSSIVWLVASILLMSIGLFGLYADAQTAREEAITKQQTQQLGGFLAMLLQWAVGLPLLAILGVIWLVKRRDSKSE
jgi:hypothetical protein